MKEYKKKKVYIAIVIIMVSLLSILIIACAPTNKTDVSIDKIPEYIASGDYAQVVGAYNIASDDEAKDYDPFIEEAITNIVLSWSGEELSKEDAINSLDMLSRINNKNLASIAEEQIGFIVLESESEELYTKAEEYFEEEDYLDALKALVKIDESYSQYEFVEDFCGECEEILVALVSYPTSMDEYDDCQQKIEEYLEVINCKAFNDQKRKLEQEREDFKSAIGRIEKAKEEFEKEDYKACFDTLETAQKGNHKNRFIDETLEELHNTFIVETAQEVQEKVNGEENNRALKIAEDALSVYNCEELKSVLEYARVESDPAYSVYVNLRDEITSIFKVWKAEEFDVEQAANNAGSYIMVSGKKMLLGDYDEGSVTVLSMAGEIATALLGIDLLMDARDLSYDLYHFGEGDYFAIRLATDTIALVPVIGVVKYLKYSDEASKGIKTAEAVLGSTTTAAKSMNRILDRSTSLAKNADESADITKVLFKRYKKIPTLNERLAGKPHPKTKVMFGTNKVKYSDGRRIKGVFPTFESKRNYRLPKEDYLKSRQEHAKWATDQLKKDADKGKLDKLFTEEELTIIKSGETPPGYEWHHSEEEGLLQLVDAEKHRGTNHTGGYDLWGKGYQDKQSTNTVEYPNEILEDAS